MGYTIMTGPGEGSIDSSFETSRDTLKMAWELVRQGQREVRVIDGEGRSYRVGAFEHVVAHAAAAPAQTDIRSDSPASQARDSLLPCADVLTPRI